MESSPGTDRRRLGAVPTARRPDLDHTGTPGIWTRCPEVAIGANALSLLMPHVEPWVVASVRAGAAQLEGDIADRARGYAAQEASHHGAHRRFNDAVVARWRAVGAVDRCGAAVFSSLRAHTSVRFGVAFAAGFETVAYAGARWTDRRARRLFEGADPDATALLLWHLAEEVEHKSVAWDVHQAMGGGRIRYLVGALTSLALLVALSFAAATAMLWHTRRILNPVAWTRLALWGLSLLWEMTPLIVLACRRDHHPDDLVDPSWYAAWLRDLDAGVVTTSPTPDVRRA